MRPAEINQQAYSLGESCLGNRSDDAFDVFVVCVLQHSSKYLLFEGRFLDIGTSSGVVHGRWRAIVRSIVVRL